MKNYIHKNIFLTNFHVFSCYVKFFSIFVGQKTIIKYLKVMSKQLNFDAKSVTTSAHGSMHIDVEVMTDCMGEILNNFEPKEIIENYDQIDELYELMKGKFE